tara:strand:- start:979 stop:2241 length:1263 start_codon:yes stop_codon:yes gene_type:complete
MFWNKREDANPEELEEIQRKIVDLETSYEEKLNPAQENIERDQGTEAQYTSRLTRAHVKAYNTLEVVNRGVNLVVDLGSDIELDIKDRIPRIKPTVAYNRPEKLHTLFNFRANPYMSSSELKAKMILDIIIEGNAFVYFDGMDLYILPACNVEIIADTKTFISHYRYDNKRFEPEEIIHIRDNSATTIFRGSSRLSSATDSISILNRMNTYQDNFFKNNTILGIVLKTPTILSNKIKQRKVLEWLRDYNPTSGGRKPLILDGGYEVEALNKYTFKELDFMNSIAVQEKKILEALGVPPILLDSGNNANIAPNLKLLYINTILPLLTKITSAFEIYFGFDLKPVTANILALRPELRDEANYYSTLVNAGIITRNEARAKLRWDNYVGEDSDEMADTLVLPANIAGSAASADVGGRPDENTE